MLLALPCLAAEPIKALIVDGQNNHAWRETTPVLKKLLEETGLFRVDVATSPARGEDLGGFRPKFAQYAVVVSNYNGADWAAETQKDFENYMRAGGGLVCYHAADNPFPGWKAYNEMIAVAGWGKQTGALIRYREGKFVRDETPGRSGHHGPRHVFEIIDRDMKHPITRGLPEKWLHNTDELYDSMRGPAKIDVLSTAFSKKQFAGTEEHEPMLMVNRYGKGRIFHTTLGHDLEAMRCVGFIATYQRGAEWAATGKVTQKAPKDFPTADKISLR
jgi:type 1 glutamine amidotransferase